MLCENFSEEFINKYQFGKNGRIGLIIRNPNIGDMYFFISALTYAEKN